jgi:hypothetical protein
MNTGRVGSETARSGLPVNPSPNRACTFQRTRLSTSFRLTPTGSAGRISSPLPSVLTKTGCLPSSQTAGLSRVVTIRLYPCRSSLRDWLRHPLQAHLE